MSELLYFMGQALLFGTMYLLGRYSVKAEGYDAGYIDGLQNAIDTLRASADRRTPAQPEREAGNE